MYRCPKCSSTRISGPHYRQGRFGGERLTYSCVNCGYSSSEPCHDTKDEQNPFAGLPEHLHPNSNR